MAHELFIFLIKEKKQLNTPLLTHIIIKKEIFFKKKSHFHYLFFSFSLLFFSFSLLLK